MFFYIIIDKASDDIQLKEINKETRDEAEEELRAIKGPIGSLGFLLTEIQYEKLEFMINDLKNWRI